MDEDINALRYAFGHLVSGHARPDDAHAADSLDEGRRVLEILGYDEGSQTREVVEALAVHVAEDYEYTGAGTEIARRIATGEL